MSMPNCDLNTSEMADQSARKRTYRQRVTCSECGKEIDSDYADSHGKKGEKVKFVAVLDKAQKQFFYAT